MPELPEVETTRRGLEPFLRDQTIEDIVIRQRQLRWPIPRNIRKSVLNQKVEGFRRRAKYLILTTPNGNAIMHLGMSGSFRVVDTGTPVVKHDHYDWVLGSGLSIRFNDPRRFGCLLWIRGEPESHPLLAQLGPEPLSQTFNGQWLYDHARGRKASVKQFLMDGRIVVGVGNIYASESLFRAGIHPRRPAGRISQARYERLADAVKQVLSEAIEAGGTTLRDFYASDGNPGYFQQALNVYGRTGEVCNRCGDIIRQEVMGQRSTFFCPGCQR